MVTFQSEMSHFIGVGGLVESLRRSLGMAWGSVDLLCALGSPYVHIGTESCLGKTTALGLLICFLSHEILNTFCPRAPTFLVFFFFLLLLKIEAEGFWGVSVTPSRKKPSIQNGSSSGLS